MADLASERDIATVPRVVTRALVLAGLAGAMLALALAVVGNEVSWGPPGTSAYATYELLNRVAALPLLLMAAAPIALLRLPGVRGNRLGRVAAVGLLVGLAASVVGSVAEFWFFSDDPYSGAGSLGRNVSFIGGYFLGSIVVFLSMVGIGLWGMRTRNIPTWAAAPLLLLPVAFVALSVAGSLPYATVPFGVGLIGIGLLARSPLRTRADAAARP
jgi:hypothetical protein